MPDPKPVDYEKLVERLEAEEVPDFAPGLRHTSPINPDGPEAAAAIRHLIEREKALSGFIEVVASVITPDDDPEATATNPNDWDETIVALVRRARQILEEQANG